MTASADGIELQIRGKSRDRKRPTAPIAHPLARARVFTAGGFAGPSRPVSPIC